MSITSAVAKKTKENIVKALPEIRDSIVSQLMERFEEEILPFEDQNDPVRPSTCKDEFEKSLRDDIDSSLSIVETTRGYNIQFGVGDEKQLGFAVDLDEETTDCMKIIGTILQGIIGKYVLVTSEMVDRMFPNDRNNRDLGRTGRAYMMPKTEYDEGVVRYGWEPKGVWRFSGFEGIPDFFDKIEIDLEKYISEV